MSQTDVLPATPPTSSRAMTKSPSPSPPLLKRSSSSTSITQPVNTLPEPSSPSVAKSSTSSTTTDMKKRKSSSELSTEMKQALDGRLARHRTILNKTFNHPKAEANLLQLLKALARNEGDLHMRLRRVLGKQQPGDERVTWGNALTNLTHNPSPVYTWSEFEHVKIFHRRGQGKRNGKPCTYIVSIACCIVPDEVLARFPESVRDKSNVAFGHTIFWDDDGATWNRTAHSFTAKMRLWRAPTLAISGDHTVKASELDATTFALVRRCARNGTVGRKQNKDFWGTYMADPSLSGHNPTNERSSKK